MGTNPKWDRKQLMGVSSGNDLNRVTPSEAEMLVRVMEECGELVQACSKVLRWGWVSTNPELPLEQQVTNYDAFTREAKDLLHALHRIGVIDEQPVLNSAPDRAASSTTPGANL